MALLENNLSVGEQSVEDVSMVEEASLALVMDYVL